MTVWEHGLPQLISRCAAGDDQSWAQFCQEYLELVRRAVCHKLAALGADASLWSDVDDICNNVFERLLANNCRALTRIRNPKSIDAWLVAVAQNQTVDFIRQHVSRERLQAAVTREPVAQYGATVADEAVRGEQNAALQERLASMAPQDRLVLELYFIHGQKYAEIASMLGLNINTLSARLRRAKEKLRRLLEEDHDEFRLR